MKVYLVGGAVRDKLLGIESKDRDYVVVGSSVEEMTKLGFKQVGLDFPVFLHPDTNEEYALARTERKTGNGYGGFTVETKGVTIEEDLSRRDLTINSMAMDLETGKIIDPYLGQMDLQNKVLRHTSEAFSEDPLRVLRVARFSARYSFRIAGETKMLMKRLVKSGEMKHLTKERVWQETYKALCEKESIQYFYALEQCGAFDQLFPWLMWQHIVMVDRVATYSNTPLVKFGAMFYLTKVDKSEIIKLGAPTNFNTLAWYVSSHYEKFWRMDKLSAGEILDLLKSMCYLQKGSQVDNVIGICALAGMSDAEQNACILKKVLDNLRKIHSSEVDLTGLSGKEIGIALDNYRLEVIKRALIEIK